MAPPKTKLSAVTESVDLVVLRAIEPIRCDGKDVAPGAEFAVAPDSAVALVETGAAEFSGEAVEK